MELHKKINSEGTTVCITTHYLEEAENLCDNITIINHGKVIKDDSKKNLLNIISKKSVKFSCENITYVPSKLKNFNPVINNNSLFLTYDKQKVKLIDIIEILKEEKVKFTEIETFESDLEDVFIKLTKN